MTFCSHIPLSSLKVDMSMEAERLSRRATLPLEDTKPPLVDEPATLPAGPRLKVLILGLNYSPEMVGIAVYTSGLAEHLVARGHTVSVVSGKPYYPNWTLPDEFRGGWKRRSTENGVDLTRVAHYVPANPTGVRRIIHHVSFAMSSLPVTLWRALRMKPDVVFTVAPSLIAAPVAFLAAKVSRSKTWLHIQDFEVEAAAATGLVRNGGMGLVAATGFERWVIRLFDHVSSISPAMCAKLLEKGCTKENISQFRNWADVNAIRPLDNPSPYRFEWNIRTPHVALYSGNIANKQGIDIIVETARRLKHRTDLTFVVCGEGPNRAKLEAKAADLNNIIFRNLQPLERLGDLLGLGTLHLLPQMADAADLVLPSKLTNMLASGRPVVGTADLGTGLHHEIDGCGLIVPPEDTEAFAGAIETLMSDDAMWRTYAAAARKRAEERWEKNAIIGMLEEKFCALAVR